MVDRLGEQFGEYRLTRVLGSGTFGDVYYGEHIRDNTLAAVKVLQARLTHPEDLKDFINEIRTLFRLQHPNIVPLLDFGIEGDAPYLTMAYAPHGTLRQPRGTQLPLDTVVTYIRQAAEALQYAHDRRLIHRDVKPDNILLGENEQVWLSDFGITTIAQSSRSLGTQDSAGTVTYMAPEQILGKPRPASDQYALGIIVYEWICGERPFNGTAIEVAMQHAQAAPLPLRGMVPALAPAIEQVVLKALEKNYEQRYSSVREFAQALARTVEQSKPLQGNFLVETEKQNKPAQSIPRTVAVEYAGPNPQKISEQWVKDGSFHEKAGRYKEAIKAYDYAIALNPQHVKAYINRGNAYADLEQYHEAIADYSRVLLLNPRNEEAYTNRGNAYADLEQYHEAIADYGRALQLNPYNAENYTNRGIAYGGLGKYRKAIDDYERALELNPRDAAAYGGRGLAYNNLKDYQRALRDFEYALRLDPSITWFITQRDDAYRKLGKI